MFFDRGVMGREPTQGDEKQLLFSNYSPWKHHSPLCHLDRSEAQWRDLCVDALSWKCFSAAAFSPLAIKRLARGELSEERTRLRIYPRTDHHRSIPQDVAAHKDPHGAIAGQAKYQQLNNRPSCPPLQLARQSSSARIAREVG